MIDRWGIEIAGEVSSIDAWNNAWSRFLHFTNDPLALLAEANEHDATFAMGSVIQGVYAVTAGVPLDDPEVAVAVERAAARGAGAHADALRTLASGEFTSAAQQWGELGATGDFAAYRFAHDVFLHVGDAELRLHWSEVTAHPDLGSPRDGFINGMHAFSLNEVGRFEEALAFGERALAADPLDLWARHALAHVHEDTDDTPAAIGLLEHTTNIWADQDQLALHLWWHLGLRYLAAGRIDDAMAIHDAQIDSATTAFRLCDLTSLLWRSELAGHGVGDRWDVIADRWAAVDERHTCGFLDVHAALAFIRRPNHPGAEVWFAGLDARPDSGTEIDDIFTSVVRPLVTALRVGDHATIDTLGASTARIGGSNAQRQIIPMTAGAFR